MVAKNWCNWWAVCLITLGWRFGLAGHRKTFTPRMRIQFSWWLKYFFRCCPSMMTCFSKWLKILLLCLSINTWLHWEKNHSGWGFSSVCGPKYFCLAALMRVAPGLLVANRPTTWSQPQNFSAATVFGWFVRACCHDYVTIEGLRLLLWVY